MQKFPLLEVIKVNKYYNGKTILEDINFKLFQSQIITLIGQNGSGKTSVARIIAGLDSNYSGRVISKFKLKINYLPQKINLRFHFPMKVIKLIKLISQNEKIDLSQIDYLEEFVDFDQLQNLDISELSGGELQKIFLIATLLRDADLIVLDEPIQYLDLKSQQLLYKILKNYILKNKSAIFMISHDLFSVMKNSDQVICLNQHICCSGKPSDLNIRSDFTNAVSEIGIYIHNHDHTH